MTGNYQRTPIGASLPRIAQEAVLTALQQNGKALPCQVVAVNGQFVTVSFDVNGNPFTIPNVTIPINTSRYDWLPVQTGDLGYTQAADVSLAAVSGINSNTPNLAHSMNLTALAFQPVGNKAWSVPASTQRVVQGPGGVLLRDTGNATTLNVTPSEINLAAATSITMTAGGHTITINSTGVIIDGKVFLLHEHTNVTIG